MSGGTASSVQSPFSLPQAYLGQTAANATNVAQGLPQYNTYGQNLPQASAITQGMVNNPYAGQFQGGANVAGPMAQNQALGQYGVGQQLAGLGANTLPGLGVDVMQTAFDPQSQLYNYLFNQNQQQAQASEAAAGVGTSPYGAGLTNQADQLFNINWQNQQLQRQLQGLQGATSAFGTGANIAQMGEGLSAAAPGQYLQGAGTPYGTFNQIGGNQLSALSGLGQYGQQAAQIPQQVYQDLYQLLGLGAGMSNNLANFGLNQNQQNWNQLSGLGSGLGGLFGATGMFGSGTGGGAFGPSGMFGGGGQPTWANTPLY